MYFKVFLHDGESLITVEYFETLVDAKNFVFSINEIMTHFDIGFEIIDDNGRVLYGDVERSF